MTADFRPIWRRQNGRCHYCNRPILQDQRRTLVQRDLSNQASKRNMAYIHAICKPNELVRYNTDDDVSIYSDFEIFNILNDISATKDRPVGSREKHSISGDWKYIRLKHFFATSTAASVTLSFEQVEQIMKRPLPQTVRKSSSFGIRVQTAIPLPRRGSRKGIK